MIRDRTYFFTIILEKCQACTIGKQHNKSFLGQGRERKVSYTYAAHECLLKDNGWINHTESIRGGGLIAI